MQQDIENSTDTGLVFDVSDPTNIDWNAVQDAVWRRYNTDPSVRAPDPSMRMCPECGIAFRTNSENHKFCCPSHKNRWNAKHGSDTKFPVAAHCEHCGIEFQKLFEWHIYCEDKCKAAAKAKRDLKVPERAERIRARCRNWYDRKRTKKLTEAAEHQLAEQCAVTNLEHESPGFIIPELDYIPGACVPIALDCGVKFAHWQIACLHGMMTSITGPHAPNNPIFSLFPWNNGCGWAAYFRDLEMARGVAMKTHIVGFNGKESELALGWVVRIKAPKLRHEDSIVRVTTITPVHCRSNGGEVHYTAPTANNIKGTLEAHTARRLGLRPQLGDVQVQLLDSSASPAQVNLGGNGKKLGGLSGWAGSVDLRVNPLGRFLLECAGLGMGLGGKTAFGFGRIKVGEP